MDRTVDRKLGGRIFCQTGRLAYFNFKRVISGVLDAWSAYSPECVEGQFSEIRMRRFA